MLRVAGIIKIHHPGNAVDQGSQGACHIDPGLRHFHVIILLQIRFHYPGVQIQRHLDTAPALNQLPGILIIHHIKGRVHCHLMNGLLNTVIDASLKHHIVVLDHRNDGLILFYFQDHGRSLAGLLLHRLIDTVAYEIQIYQRQTAALGQCLIAGHQYFLRRHQQYPGLTCIVPLPDGLQHHMGHLVIPQVNGKVIL